MVEVPRVALRAPWVRMQGAPTEAMPGHRRGGATPQTGPRRRNPKGASGLRPLDPRCSSSPMHGHRLLLVPCQQPQIPGARHHATFTTDCLGAELRVRVSFSLPFFASMTCLPAAWKSLPYRAGYANLPDCMPAPVYTQDAATEAAEEIVGSVDQWLMKPEDGSLFLSG